MLVGKRPLIMLSWANVTTAPGPSAVTWIPHEGLKQVPSAGPLVAMGREAASGLEVMGEGATVLSLWILQGRI